VNVARSHPRAQGEARLVPTPEELRHQWKTAWPWLFWALWGVWLAVSDLREDGLQSGLMRLQIGATVLAVARPRRWWLWSLSMAAWVMVGPMLAVLLGRSPFTPGEWMLAPLPAIVGGYLGRQIASVVRRPGPASRPKLVPEPDPPGVFPRELP